MSSWRRPATAIRPINVRTCRQLAQDPAICRRSSFGRTSPWEPARLQGEMSPAARRSRIRSALPAIAAIAALLLAVLLVAAPAAAAATRHRHHQRHHRDHRVAKLDPVIFVHGFEGSGSQFESQAMRLHSNGYPAGWIGVLEYDSTQYAGAIAGTGVSPTQEAPLFTRLDQLVARMKAVTHRPKVELP